MIANLKEINNNNNNNNNNKSYYIFFSRVLSLFLLYFHILVTMLLM